MADAPTIAQEPFTSGEPPVSGGALRGRGRRRRRRGVTIVLAHGAGAGMTHPFLVGVRHAVSRARGFDAITFNFPYMERRAKAPNTAPQLEACYRALIATLAGSRLARRAAARHRRQVDGRPDGDDGGRRRRRRTEPVAHPIAGVVALGYPLHPPGRPEQLRVAHFATLRTPLLVVQGTRDDFGSPDELAPHLAPLGARATIHPRRARRPQLQGHGPAARHAAARCSRGSSTPWPRGAGRCRARASALVQPDRRRLVQVPREVRRPGVAAAGTASRATGAGRPGRRRRSRRCSTRAGRRTPTCPRGAAPTHTADSGSGRRRCRRPACRGHRDRGCHAAALSQELHHGRAHRGRARGERSVERGIWTALRDLGDRGRAFPALQRVLLHQRRATARRRRRAGVDEHEPPLGPASVRVPRRSGASRCRAASRRRGSA